jgi:molybdate transport system regulatory protein
LFTLRSRTWLERDGKPIFGDGRAALLSAIQETQSLAAASRQLGIPYRTAWKHLNAMEEGCGERLVERRTGGAEGGGCSLTAAGERLLARYRDLRADLDKVLARHSQEFQAGE